LTIKCVISFANILKINKNVKIAKIEKLFNKMSELQKTEPEECHVNVRTEPNFIDESLNDLDQEDPILIEALKKMMVKPAKVNR
jgi:hypothetical protein